MEKLPLFDKNIRAIYFMANSPLGLYTLMRESIFIYSTLASISSEILITEFKKRISEPISSSEEIADIYAILIALTFKDKSEVEAFFKTVLEIKYEWFSQIADYYLTNYIPTPVYQTIDISPNIVFEGGIKTAMDDISYTETSPNFKHFG